MSIMSTEPEEAAEGAKELYEKLEQEQQKRDLWAVTIRFMLMWVFLVVSFYAVTREDVLLLFVSLLAGIGIAAWHIRAAVLMGTEEEYEQAGKK